MEEEEEIKKKVWNIGLVVKDIQKFPQTYDTILGKGKVRNNTLTTVLRRKLSNLCADGTICKTSIVGTVFGKVIFYTVPKEYSIIIESGRMGSIAYCLFKYERLNNKHNKKSYYLKAEECWQLKEGLWEKMDKPKIFFEGDILRWI